MTILKVGLTGGIASGKSTVCQLFAARQVPIIDADSIARELVEPGQTALQEIAQTFGSSFLDTTGALKRAHLRDYIFTHPKEKKKLEAILHPRIRQQLHARSQDLTAPYCILVIPLLIECGWQQDVDRILLIDTDPQIQLARLQSRDTLAAPLARAMIESQCPRTERQRAADDVILNQGTIADLEPQVAQRHQYYLSLAQSCTDSGCQ